MNKDLAPVEREVVEEEAGGSRPWPRGVKAWPSRGR